MTGDEDVPLDRKRLGQAGEDAAAEYLRSGGCSILARNFRTRAGELDIVAKSRGTLVFVEVKTRRGMRYGTPGQAVGWRKQQKIIQTARYFLRQRQLEGCPCRFDVIEVYVRHEGTMALRHFPGAFET